jgi:chromosome partitioning protein
MRLLIHNQKGGVGKTTTAANLGAALLRSGVARRVLLADMDPQMHLTAMLGHGATAHGWTVADWLDGQAATFPADALAVPDEPGLALVPGCADTVPAVAPPATGGDWTGADWTGADWTVIDSAPAWSDHMAILAAWADLILCPLEPDFLGLSGVSRLLLRFDAAGIARSRLRFLPCRVNPRLSIHREVQARLIERLGPEMVLPVAIRASVRLSEAPGFGQTIFSHAPGSTGCDDYLALALQLALQPTLQPAAQPAVQLAGTPPAAEQRKATG